MWRGRCVSEDDDGKASTGAASAASAVGFAGEPTNAAVIADDANECINSRHDDAATNAIKWHPAKLLIGRAWLRVGGDGVGGRRRYISAGKRPKPLVTSNIFDNNDTFHTVARVIINRIVQEGMPTYDAITETLPTHEKRQMFLESLDFRRASINNDEFVCGDDAVLKIEATIGSALRNLWRQERMRMEKGELLQNAEFHQRGHLSSFSSSSQTLDAGLVYKEPSTLHGGAVTINHDKSNNRTTPSETAAVTAAVATSSLSSSSSSPPPSLATPASACTATKRVNRRRRRFFPDMDLQRGKTRICFDWNLPVVDMTVPVQSLELDGSNAAATGSNGRDQHEKDNCAVSDVANSYQPPSPVPLVTSSAQP